MILVVISSAQSRRGEVETRPGETRPRLVHHPGRARFETRHGRSRPGTDDHIRVISESYPSRCATPAPRPDPGPGPRSLRASGTDDHIRVVRETRVSFATRGRARFETRKGRARPGRDAAGSARRAEPPRAPAPRAPAVEGRGGASSLPWSASSAPAPVPPASEPRPAPRAAPPPKAARGPALPSLRCLGQENHRPRARV